MREIVHVIYVLGLTIRYKANKKIIKKYGTLEYGRHRRIKSFRSNDGSLVCMDDKVIIRDKNTSTPGTSIEPEMEEEEEISDDEDDNSSEEGNEDENDLIDENDAIIEDEHMEEVQLEAPEDVKPEIFETTIGAIRILQSLYNMVFILREPMLKEFEDTVNKELENQRRRDTKILKRDFIQSMETGLRILVNGSTNQHDQQGLMKLEAILTPLTLQLLNLGFRHESPLVEQMMAENSEGKWIPIRKVNNVLILLFEAATPAIG
uniref:SPK domain-containing protein n=1 Tax=Caenorhabditis tropicalis TaxID=1561998 RepID=A0A1I7UU72_9PELO